MRLALFLVVAIAAATPSAHAQRWGTPATAPEPAPPPVKASSDYLSRMDADADGKVSLLEYQDWLSYAFDNMDRNRDGTLAPEEQPGGRGSALSRAAHRARLAERFKLQDRNRDGSLDSKELAAPPQAK